MFELFFRLFLPVAYHFAIGKTSTNGQFPSQLLLDYRSFVYATLHLATTPWATLSLIRGDSIRELWIPQLKVTHNLSKSRHITTHHSRNSATSWTGRYVFFTTCNLIYNLFKVSTSASGNFLEASFYFWWTQPEKKEILVKLFDHFPKIAVIR